MNVSSDLDLIVDSLGYDKSGIIGRSRKGCFVEQRIIVVALMMFWLNYNSVELSPILNRNPVTIRYLFRKRLRYKEKIRMASEKIKMLVEK